MLRNVVLRGFCVALLVLIAAGATLPSQASPFVVVQSSVRNTVSLNGLWEIEGQGFRSALNVPATIALTGTVTRWSRMFDLALTAQPAVAYIEFAGVVNSAVVRLNGVEIGVVRAFTQTRLDVRAALLLNGTNRLDVDIDDRLTELSVPGGRTAAYAPYFGIMAYQFPIAWEQKPGIIRDVSLVWSYRPIATDVFATSTLSPDLTRSDVTVRVRVRGAAPAKVAALVGLTRGATPVASCTALASSNDEIACSFSVANPALWSPEQPQLYDLFVTLVDGPEAADAIYDRIGFRRVETRGNRIFLNNRPLFLRGISRHDLYGDRDFVASPELIESDLVHIKKLGANFVRAIHYPPDERVARRADELGLLMSQEIPAWADLTAVTVPETAEGMFRSMIERDYNRPSVIIWIAGSKDVGQDTVYYARTAKLAKSIDPTRLVSFVFDTPIYVPADVQRFAQTAREAGYDFYAQNGYGMVYDAVIRALPPDFPTVITEWAGSEGSDRGPIGRPGGPAFPNEPDTSFTGTFTEVHQALTLMGKMPVWVPYFNCLTTTPCVSGMVFFNWQDVPWNAFPFFVPGHVPMYHSGLVYTDRTPKGWPLAAFEWAMSLMPGDR